MGISSTNKEIQLESMDLELQNGLWNVYRHDFLEQIGQIYKRTNDYEGSRIYCYMLWHEFFKDKVEDMPYHYEDTLKHIKKYFFSSPWYRVYDIIDFTYEVLEIDDFNFDINVENLNTNFNLVLEREFSAYRIFNNKVVPISNKNEIDEIEAATNLHENFTSLKSCNTHLILALQKLSERINPDYRNSIKESISAVESLAKTISDNQKDSLGAAIDKIKAKLKIHPSLERALKSIYAYTSDSDGIRHALTEESSIDFEDAKFMLISCSAFINYLVAKANKAGIKL